MRDSKTNMALRKGRGFTLIELLVTLTIITILATASVPQVQMWTARNRGKSAVSNIISDFAKAKAIAGYSTSETDAPATSIYHNYILTRPITGIMFRKSSYTIMQRTAAIQDSTVWNDVTQGIRRVELPQNVYIENINSGATNDGAGSSPTLIFTSSGRVKQSNGLLVPLGAGLPDQNCGDTPSTLNGRRVFNAVIRSNISDSKNIWYRLEIDSNGEYFVCVQPKPTGDPDWGTDTDGTGAEVLEM